MRWTSKVKKFESWLVDTNKMIASVEKEIFGPAFLVERRSHAKEGWAMSKFYRVGLEGDDVVNSSYYYASLMDQVIQKEKRTRDLARTMWRKFAF